MFELLIEAFKKEGFYDFGNKRYVKYSLIEENEDLTIDEFTEDFLIKHGVEKLKTDITDAFESSGYDCSIFSVAWVDSCGMLHMENFLLEAF